MKWYSKLLPWIMISVQGLLCFFFMDRLAAEKQTSDSLLRDLNTCKMRYEPRE